MLCSLESDQCSHLYGGAKMPVLIHVHTHNYIEFSKGAIQVEGNQVTQTRHARCKVDAA